MAAYKLPGIFLFLLTAPFLAQATTVTLAVSQNPSVLGAPVTLTATVTPSNATGKVTFYDGVTVLGTKTLTGGAASFLTGILPAGNRSLRAYYAGDSSNAAASSIVVAQTVNAKPSVSLVTGSYFPATNAVMGDFNGDGVADFAANYFSSGVQVYLGRGNGIFQNFGPAGGVSGIPAGTADFNGDGNADLLVLGTFPQGLLFLPGNGDGTFQQTTTPITALSINTPPSLVVADFNGDGIPDVGVNSLGIATILLGKGDGTFQQGAQYPVGSIASLAVGDFNGDGKADLAVAGGNNIAILLGMGDGTFQPARNDSIGGAAANILVADFNEDGKADFVAFSNSGKIWVQLGNGDGTFQAPATYNIPFSISAVAAGDFNGDGHADVAIAASNIGMISILSGNGDGTLGAPVNYPAQSSVPVLIPGDFNKDGKTDFFTGGILFLGSSLSLTAGGTPQSTPVGTAFPMQLQATVRDAGSPVTGASVTFGTSPSGNGAGATLSSPTAITDSSGVARVTATANQQPGSYSVGASFQQMSVRFALTNTIGPPAVLNVLSGSPQSALPGTAFSSALNVKLTDSAGNPASGLTVTFTAPSSGATATLSSSSAQTDASGVASVMATAGSTTGSYTVTASFGSLTTAFSLSNVLASTLTLSASPNPSTFGAPATLTATVTPPRATGLVTFYDGATVLGTKPLVSGTAVFSTVLLPTGTRKLSAHYSGDANYLSGTATSTQTVKSVPAVGFSGLGLMNIGSINILRVAVGDFNSDGKADLAILNSVNNQSAASVAILLGKGDGTFQPPVSYPVGTGVSSIVIADFNVDGNPDIAVSSTDSQNNGRINLLLGNGDGTFRPASTLSAPNGPFTVADFNGDGKPDLLVAGSMVILPGNGDGTFQAPITVPGLPSFAQILVGDFNGDGIPDIVVMTPNVSIGLGNGDGTFQPLSLVSTVVSGGFPVAGDFNGDGKLDLMAINIETNRPAVLLGNGDGTFQTPIDSLASGNVSLVSDFNGDGMADIANLGYTAVSNVISIFTGNGDGTFQQALSYTTASALSFPVVADFNGDGRVDVAAFASQAGSPTGLAILLGVPSGVILTAAGGTPQSAVTGAPFAVPLQATVVQDGIPVNGAIVTFSAPSSGPSAKLSSTTAVTNTAGIASVNATANATIGNYVVTASYKGLTASFALINNTIGSVVATGGTPQSALLNSPFHQPLQVTVRDSAGNPTNGVTVNFTAPTSGAGPAFPLGSVVTNSLGVALVSAIANQTPGSYTVTATAGGLSAAFSLTNLSLRATASGGTPQSTVVGTAFPNALQVTVRDSAGNPVSGIDVFFNAPTTGAGAVFYISNVTQTNNAGIAAITATANNTPGTYTVTATVSGSFGSIQVPFTLTNLPSSGGGNPADLAFGKAATQSSTLLGYSTASAASAVDGNNDGSFFNGSVTATNPDTNAWWQVDLGNSATISSIKIWNRTDCCGARLADYWVFVSDNPFYPGDTPAVLQTRTGMFVSHQTAAPNPSVAIPVNAQGRYVRVQLNGTDYLSLAEVQVFGTGAPSATNLAPGKAVSQSSTLPGFPTAGPLAAIDGRTDGSFFNGSVTATNLDANAWWQADLGAVATINSVAIWNRTDCCGSRLSDYWVFVSSTPFSPSDTPATLQNRHGIFASHQTTAPNPSSSITVNTQGRYVRVQLSGTDYLSLAEVQIFGTGGAAALNLAVGRPATQSSTLAGTPAAGAAVDGNTDGSFTDGSVTATNPDANAWWQVDLGASTTINSVAVWNRTDCCASRLTDFWVFVSDTPFLATDTPATLQNRPGIFASHQTSAPNPTVMIPVNAQGRYVRVQLSGTDYLSLAEVQIFGVAAGSANLAAGKSASQSSTLAGIPSAAASSAVDGNTDGRLFDGSVTATNSEPNAWWQVDLGASATIDSVTIWNRTDCCGSRLGYFFVFVSDTPFLPTDTPSTLVSRAGTFAIQQVSPPNPSTSIPVGAAGRYVRVQLGGTDYLSLAEVQVFGH